MKLLVTGAGGQLAWELQRLLDGNTLASDVQFFSRETLDISDTEAVEKTIALLQPDAVINTAAYTAVDRAEQEIELASNVNALGAQNLASSCAKHGVYLLHISTDFVFSGVGGRPKAPDASREPLSVYGRTKAEGEIAIASTMQKDWAIIRTAWVYSSHGANFVKSMLRLMAEKPALGIVSDQVGSPTWAKGLAEVCMAVLQEKLQGIYHWTDAGVASWYDFAVAIQELALDKGLLSQSIPINPIATEDYPTPAERPAFSVLDKFSSYSSLPNIPRVHWRQQLSAMLDELT